MLVEAIRLTIVIAAVLAASRVASARPDLLGDVAPQTTVLLVTGLAAGVSYILGGVIARTVDRLMRGAEERISRRHASEILAATAGLLVGLALSALGAWPVVLFVDRNVVTVGLVVLVTVLVTTFTTRLATRKRTELFGVLGVAPVSEGLTGGCLLDSSAAIDGRVLALFKAGLLPQPLCVPAFVVWEMQGIADSADPMRRRRGQRGLDMLGTLREAGVAVRVIDEDPSGTADPDAKLVVIARRRGLPIVTSDANLAKAAELQGIGVLSLHRLADLVRPPVLVGERTVVRFIREGRERGQGVGYLDDGTMVVTEQASGLLGEEAEVEITTVLSNDTGRMLFAKLANPPHGSLREVR